MTQRPYGLAAIFIAAAIVATACSQQPSGTTTSAAPSAAASASAAPTVAARSGGNFRFGQGGDLSQMDPWNASDGNTFSVTRQMFETLVDFGAQDFKVAPALATKWTTSADGKEWTMTLRSGVKFHDGTDFNAQAVVFNFERGRNTKSPNRPTKPVDQNFSYWTTLWGGYDNDSVISKIEAKDPTTVVFTTKVPYGPFLVNLAMPVSAIISPKSITDDKDGFMLPGSKGIAGTGPFLFKPGAWKVGESMTLERNPSYWRKDDKGVQLPYLDKVTFRAVKDNSARIAELKAGTLDAIKDFPPGDMATIKQDANLMGIPRPSFNVGYIAFNVSKQPFDKVEVRKAIAMAINKQPIVAAIYSGEAKAASQLIPPGTLGYDESVTEFYKYDAAAAKKLLADAGFPNGFSTELWYMPVSRPYFPDPKKVAEAFASDLAKIGIKAELKTEDWTQYRADARDNKLGMWLLGWTGDNGDPDNFFWEFFKPTVKDGKDGPTTAGAWVNPQAWDLLRKGQTETDQTKRADIYKQVSKIVQQDVPRIPMFHSNPPTAASKKVTGFLPHPTGGESFVMVSLATK